VCDDEEEEEEEAGEGEVRPGQLRFPPGYITQPAAAFEPSAEVKTSF